MNSIIDTVNLIASKVIDIILLPFSALSPGWGLIFVSALTGILLIFLYGLVSNQKAIKGVKRKISASILEVILYRHDIGQCLKAQGRMLAAGFKYFLLAVPPLIILMIPCIIILAQLNLRYEERPLETGESLVLTATLKDTNKLMDTKIEPPAGLQVSEPLRISEDKQVVWKINAVEPGKHLLRFTNSSDPLIEKNVYVGAKDSPLYSNFYNSWMWTILYPKENKDLSNAFTQVSLSYPKSEHSLLGMEMHWIIIFFLVSLVSGLIAARFFKVEI